LKEREDTFNRLFTGKGTKIEKYNVDRAYYLKNQMNKGKNWDVITWANNDLELKPIKYDVGGLTSGSSTTKNQQEGK